MTNVERWEREQICKRAGVQPTPASLYRCLDGYSIQANNGVKLLGIDKGGLKTFEVISQSNPDKVYRVSFDLDYPTTTCTCEDWHKNDMREAKTGCPFSTHQCKHGIAARIAWNRLSYRLDDNPTRPVRWMTKRELKHRFDRKYGETKWRIEQRAKDWGVLMVQRYSRFNRTALKVYVLPNGLYEVKR